MYASCENQIAYGGVISNAFKHNFLSLRECNHSFLFLPLESSRSVCSSHKLVFHLSESLLGTEDRQKLHKIKKDLEP